VNSPARQKLLFPYVGGNDLGGSHISSLKLIRMLQDIDEFEPIIGLHRPRGRLAAYIREQGLEFVPLPAAGDLLEPRTRRRNGWLGGGFAYVRKTLPALLRFIAENNISIVHTNDGRMHASWALPTALSRASHVWHHRGDPEGIGINMIAPVLADWIITVSRFAKPRRPVRPIDHKWSVVHSPFDANSQVDRGAARAALLAELGVPPGTRFLAYVGELHKRKRPVHFVDAVADYIEAHPEVPVMGLIFGVVPDGFPALDRAARDRAAERGIPDRVRLLGFRSPIEPYMAALDLLLVPALKEPFGRTLIEAMLLGTVVVATNHGGNPEAIINGETGYLVDPDDSRAFVGPIHRMLSDPAALEHIRDAALAHARSIYRPENHLRGVLDVYRYLLPFKPSESITNAAKRY
jgi:glycosyltransferase involved in cell wall biosynthesis